MEPQSIDRRRARSQIDHFKQLSQLLEQVRKQIADLKEISSAYEEVEKYTIRSASIKALAANYSHEEQLDALASIQHEMTKSKRTRQLKYAAKNLAASIARASEERDAARDAWTSIPEPNRSTLMG